MRKILAYLGFMTNCYSTRDTYKLLTSFGHTIKEIYNSFIEHSISLDDPNYCNMMIRIDSDILRNYVIMAKYCSDKEYNISYMIFNTETNTLICNFNVENAESLFYDYLDDAILNIIKALNADNAKIQLFNYETNDWDSEIF